MVRVLALLSSLFSLPEARLTFLEANVYCDGPAFRDHYPEDAERSPDPL